MQNKDYNKQKARLQQEVLDLIFGEGMFSPRQEPTTNNPKIKRDHRGRNLDFRNISPEDERAIRSGDWSHVTLPSDLEQFTKALGKYAKDHHANSVSNSTQ